MTSAAARRRWAGLAILVTLCVAMAPVAAAAATSAAAPTGAAGDPTLAGYLIADPEPGWTAASQSSASQFAQQAAAAQSYDGIQPNVAAVAWSSPSGVQQIFVVLLDTSTPGAGPVAGAAQGVARNACSGDGAATFSSDPSIAGSVVANCTASGISATNSPTAVTLVDWVKGPIFAMVVGLYGVTTVELEAAALQQNGALPGSGLSLPIVLLLVAGGLVVCLVVYSLVRWRTGAAGRATVVAGPVPGPVGWVPPGARGEAAALMEARTATPLTAAVTRAAAPTQQAPRWGAASQEARGPWASRPASAPAATAGGSAGGGGAALARPPASADTRPLVDGKESLRPPGWYPVSGNPYEQKYFDGNSVIAHKRWEGEAWVDVGTS